LHDAPAIGDVFRKLVTLTPGCAALIVWEKPVEFVND
jgi:hypothetical protein